MTNTFDEKCSPPCFMVGNLTERVDRLEISIASIDKKASISEVLLGEFKQAIERNTNTIEAFKGVATNLEKAMVTMQSEIRNASSATSELKEEVKQTKEDVKDIKKKFDESEEKSKIDFRAITKDILTNKMTYLLGGGLFTLLCGGVWFVVVNFDKIQEILILFNQK